MSLLPDAFSEPVAHVLSGYVGVPMPLTRAQMQRPDNLKAVLDIPPAVCFPGARQPDAALAGLLLRVGAWDECHRIAQDLASAEGSYWHAIVHRIEPESANARYWFRKVGRHAIFPSLRERAAAILAQRKESSWPLPPVWDPGLFVDLCDRAREQPPDSAAGNSLETLALEIQDAEWELLFQWCAAAEHSGRTVLGNAAH